MEKERKITAPEGCEIEKVKIVDGVAVVTFKEKERDLPKSWEEFCDLFPIKKGEAFIDQDNQIQEFDYNFVDGRSIYDTTILPDRATAEAILALIQLIQLRNCYNGDWVPNWRDKNEDKYVIVPFRAETCVSTRYTWGQILYFKTEELCNEFLRCFRPLIEKLKPLYGIKEGGEE